jgi:RsiW-degrading membrane proteinase PrsW (M82 family)
MIASGTISTFAGISFFLQAADHHASLSNLAGYALLGGVFFLVSALRLGRNGNPDGQ